jgi:hypothetical protein
MVKTVFLWKNFFIERILPIRQHVQPATDQANPPPVRTMVFANAPDGLTPAFEKTSPRFPLTGDNLTNQKIDDEGAS